MGKRGMTDMERVGVGVPLGEIRGSDAPGRAGGPGRPLPANKECE